MIANLVVVDVSDFFELQDLTVLIGHETNIAYFSHVGAFAGFYFQPDHFIIFPHLIKRKQHIIHHNMGQMAYLQRISVAHVHGSVRQFSCLCIQILILIFKCCHLHLRPANRMKDSLQQLYQQNTRMATPASINIKTINPPKSNIFLSSCFALWLHYNTIL